MPDAIRESLTEAKRIAKDLGEKTHYEVLGVARGAPEADVRGAFRRLAREFHVDRFARFNLPKEELAEIQAVFIAVNRANEVLSDAAQRKEYDLSLEAGGGKPVDPRSAADAAQSRLNEALRAEKLIRDGITLLRNSSAEAAAERLDEALTLTPDDPLAKAARAYAEFVGVQARGGSTVVVNRTREILESITTEFTKREEPFLYLGRVYRSLGQLDHALAAFQNALRANPHCAEAGSELRHVQRKTQPAKKGLFGRRNN